MDGTAATARVTGPRIRYLDIAAGPLNAAAQEAASLGFTHAMIPPPWRRGAGGDAMLAADLSVADPALGAGWSIAGAAAASPLPLLMDVVIDRVACGSKLVAEAGGCFVDPDPAVVLDPRLHVDIRAAEARLGTVGEAAALGGFWEQKLAAWRGAGVAGFRLIGLNACPAASISPLVTALRRGAGSGLLFVWTPGMRRDAVAALQGLGVDGLFGSLPWWDFASPWLWDEVAALTQAAPLIGCAEAPAGPRLGAGSPAARRCAQSVAAALGAGWMDAGGDTGEHTLALNVWRSEAPCLSAPSAPVFPAGRASGSPVIALLRTDTPDVRVARSASLVAINTDTGMARSIEAGPLFAPLGGRFAVMHAAHDGTALAVGDTLSLAPGEARAFTGEALEVPAQARTLDTGLARAAAEPRLRLAIEAVTPCVDGGAFAVKRTAGELVTVEADVLFDGHDKIATMLRWRSPGGATWQEVPMAPLGNDRWSATFPLQTLGLHHFVVTAWRDRFATFRDELAKKVAAGLDVHLECIEGEQLVRAAIERSNPRLAAALTGAIEGSDPQAALLSDTVAGLMARADNRPFRVQSAQMPLDAERIGARFASWYEIFPRSMSDDEQRHGTFADVQRHLPRIRDMGFDVLYFPPIHPIGLKNRKGRNNTLTPARDDPGSPYAIGSADGGHDAIHPQLGTLADFRALREAAEAHGLELALDFAIQCSPDHPWLKNHPGWFDWRPDGSIRYAENPPKKYEDIVNVDFYAEDAIPDLWIALCDTVLFWAEQGVRLFRVDNPHTKAFPFWQWMIAEVRRRYPDAAFLAEAFTRPKIMYRLAKIGFSQSYTYFTWRNTKAELTAYFTELSDGPPRDFFRPHLFVNTPDINPPFLQTSGRAGFLLRAALAATLSGLWGVYCGFELCESQAIPGREEYADSEKYQLRAWDWDRPGNIVAEIAALNAMRRDNPALQTHLGVSFLASSNDLVLSYEKATPDRSNVVLVAVSLDPYAAQESSFDLPLWKWRLPDDGSVLVDDLVTGDRFTWTGRTQRVRLTQDRPYAIWRVRPATI
jgi:starch synthase (maltosyl-transferring)